MVTAIRSKNTPDYCSKLMAENPSTVYGASFSLRSMNKHESVELFSLFVVSLEIGMGGCDPSGAQG